MWEKHVSKSTGKTYYFDPSTGKSQYDRPSNYKSKRPAPSAQKEGKKMRLSHLLVKHEDSRRPASWRSPDGITRTREEARKKLQKLRDELTIVEDDKELPKSFAKLATKQSDCSSAKRGGDLGSWIVGSLKFMPEFEDAAKDLKVNELSEITETKSGYHIILRVR